MSAGDPGLSTEDIAEGEVDSWREGSGEGFMESKRVRWAFVLE